MLYDPSKIDPTARFRKLQQIMRADPAVAQEIADILTPGVTIIPGIVGQFGISEPAMHIPLEMGVGKFTVSDPTMFFSLDPKIWAQEQTALEIHLKPSAFPGIRRPLPPSWMNGAMANDSPLAEPQREFPMTQETRAHMGDYTIAKLDFLRRGADGEFGVNYRHCRPLHPHGARMVKEGFLTMGRHSRGGRARMTTLSITETGLAELARLEKRAARKARKHGGAPLPSLEPAPTPAPRRTPAEARAAKTRAIAFLAKARQIAREGAKV